MGQGIAAPEGQLVEIPVELPDEGTVIVGEHDIPPAGAGFLPQPDVELALEADPVASLRLKIRGVAVKQGVLIIQLRQELGGALVFNGRLLQALARLLDEIQVAGDGQAAQAKGGHGPAEAVPAPEGWGAAPPPALR